MSNNPYESPTAAPEEGVKRRGVIAWRKGLLAGAVSWMVAVLSGSALFAVIGGPAAPQFVQAIIVLAIVPLLLATGREGGATAIGGLLSGILLHTAFWTIVFTFWRRRAGLGREEVGDH